MAAVHLHNALFTPVSPPSSLGQGAGHSHTASSSSDVLSARHFGDTRSSRELRETQHIPMASEAGAPVQHSFIQRDRKLSQERRRQRSSRLWLTARLALSFTLLLWLTYCTARYFVALLIYGEDPVRSLYALGMDIASAVTVLFFAVEAASTWRFFGRRLPHRLAFIVHSFTYFSSTLVMIIAILNLVLVFQWRSPHGPADTRRSIQGRCNWDLDVVWSGTGMACSRGHAMPFGMWLGAAIIRLVISAVLLVAYHIAVHAHVSAARVPGTSAAFDTKSDESHMTGPQTVAPEPRPSRYTRDPQMRLSSSEPVSGANVVLVSEAERQHRSLSFTAAGQVLSRIEGGEEGEEDELVSTSSSSSDVGHPLREGSRRLRSLRNRRVPPPHSESPEPFPSSDPQSFSPRDTSSPQPSGPGWFADAGTLPTDPPASSIHRHIAAPSNDLQDFASAFQNLVSRINHDTQEGMALDDPAVTPREEPDTVRVLGSYITRMSTIESLASREMCGSACSSPALSDTAPSPGSPSQNLSRNPTLNSRGRDREDVTASPSTEG